MLLDRLRLPGIAMLGSGLICGLAVLWSALCVSRPDDSIPEYHLLRTQSESLSPVDPRPAMERAELQAPKRDLLSWAEVHAPVCLNPEQRLELCLIDLKRALHAHYTPRALDAQLASIAARHGLQQDNALQSVLFTRLVSPTLDESEQVSLLTLARTIPLDEHGLAVLRAKVLPRVWNSKTSGALRQEALRSLAALGGTDAVLRLCELTIEAPLKEVGQLRTALANTREGSALAAALEASRRTADPQRAVLLWSALETAVVQAALRADAPQREQLHRQLSAILEETLADWQLWPELAARALVMARSLDPRSAELAAENWLQEPALPVALRKMAVQTLPDPGDALEQLDRMLLAPRADQDARLASIEAALPLAWPVGLRLGACEFLRERAEAGGAPGRRAVHALAQLGAAEDLDWLRSLARDAADPLTRAAARSALIRAESEWGGRDL